MFACKRAREPHCLFYSADGERMEVWKAHEQEVLGQEEKAGRAGSPSDCAPIYLVSIKYPLYGGAKYTEQISTVLSGCVHLVYTSRTPSLL